MKDISKLSVELKVFLEKTLQDELKKAHNESVRQIWEDIKASAPGNVRGDYVSSIKLGETKEKKNIISTEIYSNLKVGGAIPKWVNVPLANFVNWGTGPLGEATNEYPHGYPYTTDEPWNAAAWVQFKATGTWGMKANPHFYLSLQKNTDKYIENLRKAVKACGK